MHMHVHAKEKNNNFMKIKSIIRYKYMMVHSCCCIFVFVMTVFEQNLKRIQIRYEFCISNLVWKISLEKEKENLPSPWFFAQLGLVSP